MLYPRKCPGQRDPRSHKLVYFWRMSVYASNQPLAYLWSYISVDLLHRKMKIKEWHWDVLIRAVNNKTMIHQPLGYHLPVVVGIWGVVVCFPHNLQPRLFQHQSHHVRAHDSRKRRRVRASDERKVWQRVGGIKQTVVSKNKRSIYTFCKYNRVSTNTWYILIWVMDVVVSPPQRWGVQQPLAALPYIHLWGDNTQHSSPTVQLNIAVMYSSDVYNCALFSISWSAGVRHVTI